VESIISVLDPRAIVSLPCRVFVNSSDALPMTDLRLAAKIPKYETVQNYRFLPGWIAARSGSSRPRSTSANPLRLPLSRPRRSMKGSGLMARTTLLEMFLKRWLAT
jgi:hypothetical protein